MDANGFCLRRQAHQLPSCHTCRHNSRGLRALGLSLAADWWALGVWRMGCWWALGLSLVADWWALGW